MIFSINTEDFRKAKVVLKELTIVDFKLRYQGSFLGYVWAVLRPLLLFLVIYLVFTRFFDVGRKVTHYPIYLLLGITVWGLFSEMTNSSIKSVVSRGGLIRKLNFPKSILPLIGGTSAAINSFFNMIIVIFIGVFIGVDFRIESLLVILPLIEVFVFGAGLSFFLAALYVRFRDLNNIWLIALQAGFYLTPIIYPLTIIDSTFYQRILMINPIAQAMQDARWLLVTKDSITIDVVYGSHLYRAIPVLITVVVFCLGLGYYNSKSSNFAEEV